MRFLHMADVHLGCLPDGRYEWREERRRELWETFRESVQDAVRLHADLVLIAGDLFHTTPDERSLREVAYLFSSCRNVCFALIAGNHDCMTPGSAWDRVVLPPNVALLGPKDWECVTFDGIGCEVYGFSYERQQIEERRYDLIRPDENDYFHILLAHGGDALHIPYSPQAMDRSGFDYIALGHIHKPGMVLKNRAAYSGALSPIDAGDEGPHGYLVGDTSGHLVTLRFVPRARREYRSLVIDVREDDTASSLRDFVAQTVGAQGNSHIYKLVLKGQRDPGLTIDPAIFDGCGMILSVTDQTRPAFYLEELKDQYRGQLVGRYIESFQGEEPTEVRQRALQLGLEALLGQDTGKTSGKL